MKKVYVFLLPLAMLLCACCAPSMNAPEPCRRADGPAAELFAIDSLMWRQPDSAFALLQQFAVSPATDSLDEYNTHYFHLLLAELLYKNDCAQTNRPNVLQAVDYFDSLTINSSRASCRHCRRVPQSPKLCGDFPFLDARTHYIKGVGYYEKDSVVQACAEYLKTLEVMEAHFEEKDLIGEKAKFIVYTYNRLMEIFSSQFMMEPAIECGEKALLFCANEPTSSLGASRILYQIGKQYDEMKEWDKAKLYYDKALENMTDTDNLVYRDIIASKSLCDYDAGIRADQPLDELKRVIELADSEVEKLNRFLSIGGVYYEEGLYDSAMRYLEPVFKNDNNNASRMEAAEYLHVIYDSIGAREKTNEIVRFLADHKKLEGEHKAMVSRLEAIYKSYMTQKQKKETEIVEKRNVKRLLGFVIPMVSVTAMIIITIAILRSRKTQKVEQKHKNQQAALSGRLKQSNEELRKLKDQIKLQSSDKTRANAALAASFAEEPICRLIMERVKEGCFLSQMDCKIYKDYALDKNQLTELRCAVNRHYNQFTVRICKAHPELTRSDLDYCCLYLLDLSDADIAALMQRAYNTVNERHSKLKRIFKDEKAIGVTLLAIAEDL